MKIKIPHVVLLMLACIVMSITGTARIPVYEATGTFGTVVSIANALVKLLPYVLFVLTLVAAYVGKIRRLLAEVAAVIAYVLAVAYLVGAVGFLSDILKIVTELETVPDMLLSSPIMSACVVYLFSGLMYFYVAARTQDEEIGGTLNGLCVLGCLGLAACAYLSLSMRQLPFVVLPMILQLCYIKRLPMPYAKVGLYTGLKEIIILALVLVLYYVGPEALPQILY